MNTAVLLFYNSLAVFSTVCAAKNVVRAKPIDVLFII